MGAKSSKKEIIPRLKRSHTVLRVERQLIPDPSIDVSTRTPPCGFDSLLKDDNNLDSQSDTKQRDRSTRNHHRRSKSFHSGVKAFEKTVIKNKKQTAVICAAIDFGTTYSGYAYSFTHDPLSVYTNKWDDSTVQLKTPTVVLMDPNKQFHSFGEAALKKYHELFQSEKNDHAAWYLFEKFKMKLFVKDGPLDRDMEIEDTLGKSMKAIDIFAGAIRFIRQHLLNVLNETFVPGDTDIHWVLTVPAIWNDLSKHFMREAATKAGIPNDMLTLALEPEAASLFCKKEIGPNILLMGSRYMLIDLGGGTADITCHEVQDDDSLKEMCAPRGGDFGGTNVDNKFISMIISIIGAPQIKGFKLKYMNDYYYMMTEFEQKKRRFNGKDDTVLRLPVGMVELCEKNVGMSISDLVNHWAKEGIHLNRMHDKMILPEKYMRGMFNSTLKQIIDLVRQLKDEVGEFDHIIFVGGFSESPYLQQVMKENFTNLLTVPKEPSLAVLKGAVIYGHETKAISSRTCRYTYGIARMIRFIPGKHPDKKKVKMGDYTFCDDVFDKHIEVGTVVSLETREKTEYHECYPSTHNQNMALLEVYKSKKKNPMFVDEEGCELVGYVKVDGINRLNDIQCKLLVRLLFGGTELIVEIKDMINELVFCGSVDFFG